MSALSPNSSNSPPFEICSLTPEDWELVLKEAGRHGLAPYLYHKLRSQLSAESAPLSPTSTGFRSADIPDCVLAELRRAYYHNVAINLQRFHYLGIALRALTAATVPVIVLKGGYLAEAVYGNIGLRVMGDIDILVRRENIPAAAEALRSTGYDPREYRLEPPTDANEFHFVHHKSRDIIELHWEIFKSEYPYAMKSEVVWPAAVPAKIAKADVLTLSPEDLVCHLAVHAGIHSYNFGLKALVDVAESIDRLPLDWKLLAGRARQLRVVRPVWLTLFLSRRMLGSAVPEAVLAELLPPDYSGTLFDSARERILLNRDDRSSGNAGNPGNPNLILLFGRKGIRAKLALAFRRAFPSPAFLASLYPVSPRSPRLVFYYLRWIRTLIKRNLPALRAKLSHGWRKEAKTAGGRDDAALMDWLIRAE
ncbi:MAG: nucleotidyltransferase family protein [Candidatus Aminicenantes bacterium]|nr:nucleotidyltransferase family protein [Candidatus Aminicenantes bacterium]